MKLTDLRPDPKNRRKHTARNVEMLQESIEHDGTGRSIVIDENDVVLAGNATIKAAAKVGLSKVTVVEAKGDEVIAVRRTGLSPKQKRALAMYDNRTAELAEWDMEQLEADHVAGLDLSDYFHVEEFDALTASGGVFRPELAPVAFASEVSPEGVDVAADRLAAVAGEARLRSEADMVTVVCPHCATPIRYSPDKGQG